MSAKLSINFMPNAVYRAEYCIRTTLAAARTYHFDTRQIIFEIVESEELSSVDHLVDIVETYQNMGFLTAIDRFWRGILPFQPSGCPAPGPSEAGHGADS